MYKEKIEKYVESHEKEMLSDICELCRIDSEKMPYEEGHPFGDGAFRALIYTLSLAEKYGFSIRNYDNYVGVADFNDKEKQLDILAHLDVVPAGEGWTETEPFEPIVKGDRIYGRGTSDDKGPAIAALYAMRAVKELKIPLKKNVRLILGTDEECGGADIAHYYAEEKEAPMTFSPDGAFPVINVEKGRLKGQFSAVWNKSEELPKLVSLHAGIKENVVPGKAYAKFEGLDTAVLTKTIETVSRKTGIKFEIDTEPDYMVTAIGEGAHASTPEEGNNALTGLIMLITELPLAKSECTEKIKALNKLIPHKDTSGKNLGIAMKDDISGELTLAFSMLDVTETGMEGFFDSRCPLCANENNVLVTVKKKFAENGIDFTTTHMNPPHNVDGDSEFVKTLLAAYEKYTGNKGECKAMGGGTYVHDLKNGVAFGASMPGTDNRMHGADEFAVISELKACVKIFAEVIINLCS